MDFIRITLIDVIDITVIAVIMFYIYKLAKGTQAPYILTGIVMIYLLWIVVRALGMEMLSAILGHIIGVGVVALIVVFQPEIRRFLQVLGKKSRNRRGIVGKIFSFSENAPVDMEFLNPIVRACTDMSATKTGALIVIQQDMDLDMIEDTGIPVDARITSSLLKNIFFKNSPLHDGAVVIREARISAAKCILPTTQSEVPVSFGMRHRAALGVSEVSDALVVVVSEETGAISLARHGQIHCGVSPTALHDEMETMLREHAA